MRRKLGTITLTVYATDLPRGAVKIEVDHERKLEGPLATMVSAMADGEKEFAAQMMRELCHKVSGYMMYLNNPDKKEVDTRLPGLPAQKAGGS